MCHYAQLTLPVPAVIVAIVFSPLVVVVPVNPAPIVIVADKEGVCSVVRIKGRDEVVVDEGSATGSLNDALLKAIKRKGK